MSDSDAIRRFAKALADDPFISQTARDAAARLAGDLGEEKPAAQPQEGTQEQTQPQEA
jgi:hypothetical protein